MKYKRQKARKNADMIHRLYPLIRSVKATNTLIFQTRPQPSTNNDQSNFMIEGQGDGTKSSEMVRYY